MSTLSKVFVVFNFIFAMLFMVASLALYAKKVNWVDESTAAIQARNKNYRDLTDLQNTYNKLAEASNQEKTRLEGAISTRDQNISDKSEENKNLKQMNDKLQTDLNGFGIQLAELKVNLTREQDKNVKLQEAIDSMRRERDTAVAAREFAESQAIETLSDLKEAEAELSQNSKRVAALTTKVLELTMMVDKARASGVLLTETGTGPVVPVSGKVLQVDDVVGIVILNVGEKDKIERGMEFLVSRGSKYIGKVSVRKVFPEMCSAIIVSDSTEGKIEVNDSAQTKN